MKLLALDTATGACSTAVWIDGAVVERYEWAPRRHAALILPMIEAVLAEAGLETRQMDAIAVGRGPAHLPGCGLRWALPPKGIAFAADLPVAPVSTLAALALGAGRELVVHTSRGVDARMGEVYWGVYAVGGEDAESLGEEQVCAPAFVVAPSGEWFGAGSGWATHADLLARRLTVSGWRGECYPRAGDVARLAAVPARRGEWVTAERALPVYLRNDVVKKPA